MGAYASTANTAKESADGVLGDLVYGVCEMQGWRKTMEDTHIASRLPAPSSRAPGVSGSAADNASRPAKADGIDDDEGDDVFVFGVFDGHGGREVAHFCKLHFAAQLPTLLSWPLVQFEPLLRESFLGIDDMLLDAQHQPELQSLRAGAHGRLATQGSERGLNIQATIRKLEEDGGAAPIEDATQLLRAELARQHLGNSPSSPHAAAPAALGQADAPSDAAPLSSHPALSPSRAPAAEQPSSPAPPSPSVRIEHSRAVQAGCTAIVACLHGATLSVANAGDSRAVLCRGGQAMALSVDHKPGNPIELERITSAGGWVSEAGRVNGNLNLSRSLGDLKYKSNLTLAPEKQVITAAPDVQTVVLGPNDEFLVLACDGIWDCKTSEQVVSFVRARLLGLAEGGAASAGQAAASPGTRKGPSAARPISPIIEELFDQIISRNPTETAGIGADNMTCVIIDLRPHCKRLYALT